MKYFAVFGILLALVSVIGMASTAEAHPHATIDLMESHSHVTHEQVYRENFIVHTFEEVIFSVFAFIDTHLPF